MQGVQFWRTTRSAWAWGGLGKGTVSMDGCQWTLYQPPTFPTPLFPTALQVTVALALRLRPGWGFGRGATTSRFGDVLSW